MLCELLGKCLPVRSVVGVYRERAGLCPAQDLRLPLDERYHWQYDERPSIREPLAFVAYRRRLLVSEHQRNRLERLAHAHLVREDAAANSALLLSAHPPEALLLVGEHLGVELRWGLSLRAPRLCGRFDLGVWVNRLEVRWRIKR